MKFNKVIYFRYLPLTKKVYQDFYMEEVESKGIEVEYWDLTALFFADDFQQEDSSELVNTLKFLSYQDLTNKIAFESNRNSLFISIVTFEARVAKLYRIFNKYNINLAAFGRNIFPLADGTANSKYQRVRHLTFSKVFRYVLNRYAKWERKIGRIKTYDFIFLGGALGWTGIGNFDEEELSNATVVKVNSDDFDRVIEMAGVEAPVSGDYILFLDEYLPLHPDTKLFNIKNIAPNQYYPQLCDFFDRVEKQFGMPVIIAAHPKALKYKECNFFCERQVIFGKTGALSKYAHFVLAHDSTSINYPIAFGKRLHFITSENICREINSVHRNVLLFSNFLGCNYQWFDKEGEINIVEEVPTKNYEKYRYDFQAWPETESFLTKDIFLEFLTQP